MHIESYEVRQIPFHFSMIKLVSCSLHDVSEDDARNYYEKCADEPLAPYFEKSEMDLWSLEWKVRYIACRDDRVLPLEMCEKFATKLWVECEIIDGGHNVMLENIADLYNVITSDQ